MEPYRRGNAGPREEIPVGTTGGLKICLKLDQKRGSVAPAVYYVVYIQRVPPDRRKKRASVPCRALLGLKALYATVDVNRRERARRTSSSNASSASACSRAGGSAAAGCDPDGVRGGGVGAGGVEGEAGPGAPSVKKHGGGNRDGGGSWRSLSLAPHPSPSPTPRVTAESLAAMPLLGHRYRYVSTIGAGRFSNVIRAEDTFRPGRSVAVKVMNLGCGALALREVRFMHFLSSLPNAEFSPVVRLVDVFTYRGHYCLVTELFDGTLSHQHHVGGDGARRNGRSGAAAAAPAASSTGSSCFGEAGGAGAGCPPPVIRHVALQLVSALLLLHNHGLIHADIKPENVLLKIEQGRGRGRKKGAARGGEARRLRDFMRGRASMEGTESLTVRLCDFGSAIHKSEAYLYYGDFEIQTLAYRAPEVLMGCPFGPKSDMYSVGVVLLELLLGRPLFHTAGSRAALLQQTVCAFGPMPLRRFRVGHFFSEYFAPDQSLKRVGTSTSSTPDRQARMGCCSCCWIGDRLRQHGGTGRQGAGANLIGSSCDGCCARRCRQPDPSSAGPAPRQLAPDLRRPSGLTGSSSWSAAHAHLSRLASAADSLSPPPPPDSSSGGGGGGGSSSSRGASEHASCQRSARVCEPRPHRFGSTASPVARQNPLLLSLLAGLLCLDPDGRLTPAQALAHPFFGEALPFGYSEKVPVVMKPPPARPTPPVKPPAARSRATDFGYSGKAPPAGKPAANDRAPKRDDGSLAAAAPRRNGVCANAGTRPRAVTRPSPHQEEPSRSSKSIQDDGSSSSSRELDRLAEMAEAIVANRRGSDSAPPPSPRRNPFLNATLLAKLKREEPAADTTVSGVSGASTGQPMQQKQKQKQQQGNHSSMSRAPSAAPASHRKRNRFLTPATLAILNPDLGVRKGAGKVAAAAAGGERGAVAAERQGWSARRTKAAARSPAAATTAAITPTRRSSASRRGALSLSPPPDGKLCSSQAPPTRAATRGAMTAQQGQGKGSTERDGGKSGEEPPATSESQREPLTAHSAGRKRPRSVKSRPIADSSSSSSGGGGGGGGGSQVVTPSSSSSVRGGGRSTTPRRAAVAAEAALLRLRDDDESSDGSLTL